MIEARNLTERGIKELIQYEQGRLAKANQFGTIANTKIGIDLVRELEEYVQFTKEMYGRIAIDDPVTSSLAFSYVRGTVFGLESFIARVRDWKDIETTSNNLISSYRKELERRDKRKQMPDRAFGTKGK